MLFVFVIIIAASYSDSSSDSEGIYSEGNSAKNSPMPAPHIAPPSHLTTSHV